MDIDQIRELAELMHEQDLAEVLLEQHGITIRLRRPEAVAAPMAPVVAAMAAPTAGAETPSTAAPGAPDHGDAHVVRSPMVGTFYTSPDPDTDPFVQVGDTVQAGQTLCIVEAMKLMNEITSDVAGEVVAILQDNGLPVEYGQELFAIRPS